MSAAHVRPPDVDFSDPRPLEWHKGKHAWSEHDGYPRHQHSINGALTIAPGDTSLHFSGSSFDGNGVRLEPRKVLAEYPEAYRQWFCLVRHDSPEEHVASAWKYLSPAEREFWHSVVVR